MVVDSSILIAIFLRENGYEQLLLKLKSADGLAMSAASYVETSMVLIGRRGEGIEKELDRFLAIAKIAIYPVSTTQAHIARDAFLRFGKGRHPARLNFGDCFAYALAIQRSEPLFFKGDDFVLTDVRPA